MPAFAIKAVTTSGEIINDIFEAPNEQAVTREMYKKGYRPISIKKTKNEKAAASSGSSSSGFFAKKVKLDELILFTKELVTLLKAGVPMLTALEALSDQSSPQFKEVLNHMNVSIVSGKSLSQAMDMHPKVFSKLYVNSVRAGEISGSLDDVLIRITTLLKHDQETRKKVKKAMQYPIFVISALVIAFVILMIKVVPNFTSMFESFDMELPLPTRMLMGASTFLQAYILYIIGIGSLIVVSLIIYIKTPAGRYQYDSFLLKLPVIGNLVNKSAMARFAKMFETLNRSGLPIIQTLTTVSSALGNAVIESIVKKVAVGIEKGEGIAGAMKRHDVFPPLVVRMIAIGEQSGSLDDMLDSISNHFDMEVEYAIEGLTSMIEPVLTIVIGVAVVVMAMGIFLPMWSMVGAIQ